MSYVVAFILVSLALVSSNSEIAWSQVLMPENNVKEMLTPVAGQHVGIGDSVLISWSIKYSYDDLDYELWNCHLGLWQRLTQVQRVNGKSMLWVVPTELESGFYRLRLLDRKGRICGITDSFFRIDGNVPSLQDIQEIDQVHSIVPNSEQKQISIE